MNGALTLMSSTLSKPMSGNSPSGAPQAAPALFTRMSTWDSRSVNAADERRQALRRREIGGNRDALAVFGEPLGSLVARVGLAGSDVGPHPVGDEAGRDHEADAPGTAGDDGHLSLESEEVRERKR